MCALVAANRVFFETSVTLCSPSDTIQLRFAPEISFHEDLSTEYSVHMQEVFDKLKDLDGPDKHKTKE